jgi:hypothetical protein
MTRKADFNAEEWSTLVEAPVLAGMRVVTAGRGGTIRESMAMGKVYAAARREQGASELLDDLVASPPTMEPGRVGSTGDIKGAVEERLREATGILEAKATADELDAYRGFVVKLAEAVAGAHKEGGFLGVGGERISDDEQRALDEIAATLGTAGDSPAALTSRAVAPRDLAHRAEWSPLTEVTGCRRAQAEPKRLISESMIPRVFFTRLKATAAVDR